MRLYHDQALNKEPGGGYTPWHCDQYYWPVQSDKIVTAWVPLQVPHSPSPWPPPSRAPLTPLQYHRSTGTSKPRNECNHMHSVLKCSLGLPAQAHFHELTCHLKILQLCSVCLCRLEHLTPNKQCVQEVPEEMGPLQFAAGSHAHDLGR